LLAWFAGAGLEGSVWVDNSASAEVAATYLTALQAGIHVVCSNKIAAAGPWAEVQRCRDAARARGVRWLNEANVGAGLPVLDTLRNLVATGDRVLRIEAAVSGSLGYIFDRFDAEGDFVAAVRAAAERGFTEPDPRLDLSGMDVARKILILAREAGAPLEGPEVERTPFLPEELFSGGVADFWAGLPAAAPALAAQRAAAHARGEKLRYVATFAEGRCTVGLRSLPPGHPLGACAGTDNWIAFTTERYPERPLIVQGSGAGAEVTAAGVLGDLLRLVGGAHGPVR
jgi:aspartokinase/homoserine dehydrogenase 1